MAKIFLLITTLVVLTTGKFIDSSESGEVDEDMIRSLGTEVEETRVELGEIQAISLGASGKASIKDKLKNMCNCDTHKDCTCCAIKEMKIPVIGSYTLKVCSAVSVAPEDKTFNFKLHLGSIQLLNKDVSYVKTEEICKKIEKYQNLEFCMRMTVTESEEKGLSGCVVLQANIMDIFNKPIYLPCLHFNGKKLHMDEAMEEYKDDGVRLNLKTLWKKFKSLFSKKPSH